MKRSLNESNDLLSETKAKINSMNDESIVQANYTAAMGSVMGAMLWKTSKTEEVINTLVNEVS